MDKYNNYHLVCNSPSSGHFMCNGEYYYNPRYRLYTTDEWNKAFYSEPSISYVRKATKQDFVKYKHTINDATIQTRRN